jgi:Holliday junction DNA helicase RuvB
MADVLDLLESPVGEEEQLFLSLRAKEWSEFFGQKKVTEPLLIGIEAAKQRNEALDHTLLYGPPGLGKTTLSHLIAKESGGSLQITSGNALTKVGDLAAILSNLQANDVLFIDEIHRLPKAVEEMLYPAMEDFALDVVLGKGAGARVVRIDLPRFTLVGATTRFGVLSAPLRDRFGLVHRLQYYQPEELVTILQRAAEKLQMTLPTDCALSLARRSRGTPRIALKLLKRVRDISQLDGKSEIEPKHIDEALRLQQVDEEGLDEHDHRYLNTLKVQFKGGPVGVQTMAAALSEDAVTLEEVIEPYLIQIGKIKRTARGRVLV